MSYIVILLIALLAIVVIVVIIWVAYSITATYQQTVTLDVPFEETYRYIPSVNQQDKYKLESIKVTITGSIKKDSPMIVSGATITNAIKENIIIPYKGCLLMHETNTFTVEENILKRCPLIKDPTLENLSILFFNKLASIMPNMGCQLVSVKLRSAELSVTHSRYKMSNYKL